MTKDEAILAMREGKKVTHRYFTPDEFVYMDGKNISLNGNDLYYFFEDGVKVSATEFWKYRTDASFETDWEIYN